MLGSLSADLAKDEARSLRVSQKMLHVRGVTTQDVRGYRRRTIWNPQNNDLGACCHAQCFEVCIASDEDVTLALRVLEDGTIGRAAQAAEAYVGRVREEISERGDEASREILVEEQRAHARLRSGQGDGTSFAGRGKGKRGADVIGG